MIVSRINQPFVERRIGDIIVVLLGHLVPTLLICHFKADTLPEHIRNHAHEEQYLRAKDYVLGPRTGCSDGIDIEMLHRVWAGLAI